MEEDEESEEDVERKESDVVKSSKEESIQVPQLMEYPVTFWRKVWKKIKNSVK